MSKKRRNYASKLLNHKHGLVFYAIVALLACACAYGVYTFIDTRLFIHGVHHDAVVTLPEGDLYVQIANTKASREQGLSGKLSIAKNEGMLFEFDRSGQYGFWMKGMNFPLDIVWIAEDGHVVNIEDSLSPSTYPKGFINTAPAKYVLELNAGVARSKGLYLGTEVKLDDKIQAR